jgi:hypothetical protein
MNEDAHFPASPSLYELRFQSPISLSSSKTGVNDNSGIRSWKKHLLDVRKPFLEAFCFQRSEDELKLYNPVEFGKRI